MPRTLTAGMQTAIAASSGEFVHFIEMAFSGGTHRLSTGSSSIPWDSSTWTAVGGALQIAVITETPDLSGGALEIRLSGVEQTLLAVMLSQFYIGRSIKVWLVHLDPTAGTIIADPVLMFSGFMNGGWSIKENVDDKGKALGTVDITGRCTSRLSALEGRKGIQANPTSHQGYFRGDRFFEYVPSLATRPVIWKR